MLCINLISCLGQTSQKQDKNKTNQKMEKFDVTKIINGFGAESEIKFTKDDTIYEVLDSNNQYVETRKKISESFTRHLVYDKKTLSLLKESTSFSKISYGIYREFDTMGNVLKEVNLDEKFEFSLDNLLKLVKIKYEVDFNQVLNNSVYRGFDEHLGRYVYKIHQHIDDYKMRYIIIDGQTGDVISDDYKFYSE